MMRSMSSAVSALRNHQTRMDVIGNNIANVNTVGYKTSRVVFKDSLNQMLRGASGATESRGGTNPQQIGMGMGLSSIDTIFGQGVAESTGQNRDVMIEGEGFFMVSADGSAESRFYTRAGNFNLDTFGNLVNADGLKVLGYQAQDGVVGTGLGGITIPIADSFPPSVTKNVVVQGNLDSRTKALDPPPDFTGEADDDAVYTKSTNSEGKEIYVLNPNYKDSVAKEIDGYVYDSLGEQHAFKVAFIKTKEGTTTEDSEFTAVLFSINKDKSMTPAVGGGEIGKLNFGTDGKQTSPLTVSMKLTPENGAGVVDYKLDLKDITQYGVESNAAMAYQDGYTVGNLTKFEIGSSGIVDGVFSNGQRKTFGQIATAVFSNPAGLTKEGGSLFGATTNSGEPQVNKPGEGSNGILKPGYLEMSGVDLGVEFTNMITTQRGFQANSRTISTTDQMLEELVNLKR